MILHKNGFIVVKVENYEKFTYQSWPLSYVTGDEIASKLADEADDMWFTKFEMQEIAPDGNYVRKYVDYCKEINIDVKILLVESFDAEFEISDKYEICELLGFDCIGTVYYSFLRSEYEYFKADLNNRNIKLNRYGFLNTLEEALTFIELREKAILSGANLEDFWQALPVRLSIVKLP